ncbi:MAG: hypothetical protein HC929_14040 [Leptolyngbyaceae cyanobacterium SM2_5_2]|nr:hypothetical protein [Leptolyngbyaceae cyanobacterium SM2_5_2]
MPVLLFGITITTAHLPSNLEAAISRATEACDNYVVLLSPQAIHNAVCLQGLLLALSLNKRVVPILLATVKAGQLPEPLQAMDWSDLRGATAPLSQSAGGDHLLRALSSEAKYHRTHTQLLLAALTWERQQRHPDYLLSKHEGRIAYGWLAAACQRLRYRPIHLVELFVVESVKHGAESSHRPSDLTTARRPIAQMTTWLKQWITG